MKLRYIFAFLTTCVLTLAGCSSDYEVDTLKSLQVSSSYISIPLEGGSNKITVQSNSPWTVDTTGTTVKGKAWLEFSALQGEGNGEITISAAKSLDGRSATIKIKNATETQYVNIIQGLQTVSKATVAQVLAGPDSKTYRVTGTVTSIANTNYGNFYLNDGTGTLYIYGTKDASNNYNWKSFNIEVGDEVTVQGPKTTYNGTAELVDAQFISVNKSLVKVDSLKNAPIAKEGGMAEAYITCKGQGVSVQIPDDAKEWLSIYSIKSAGTNAVVTFKANANAGGIRNTTVTFTTTDGAKDYSSEAQITQEGAIVDASIADFNAAAVGTTQYRLTGAVSNLKGSNFTLTDWSGSTYVYKLTDAVAKNIKEGDIVTIVGQRGEYKTTIEVLNAYTEVVRPVTKTTIADVLTKADDKNVYYQVTGTIKSIANEVFGNMTIEANGSEIYVYGLYPGYGATGDNRKGVVAAKGLKVGDNITLTGYKTSYKGTNQMGGSFLVSVNK